MTVLTADELLAWLDHTSAEWRGFLAGQPEALALPCDVRESTSVADLLLHDLGEQDGGVVVESNAGASEWRTAPLVDLAADGGRRRLMHDGAAATIEDAIARHGGEAESSATAFRALNRKDKDALLQFLSSL